MASEIISYDNAVIQPGPGMFEPDPVALFDALPDRTKSFVSAYIGECRFNGSAAAVAAGYADTPAARVQSARLLANDNVRACVKAILRANLLSDEVILTELGSVALSPTSSNQQVINEFVSKDGKQVTQIIRLDYASKVRALEILAKAAGLLTDRVSVDVKHTKTVVGISIEEVVSKRVADTTTTEP